MVGEGAALELGGRRARDQEGEGEGHEHAPETLEHAPVIGGLTLFETLPLGISGNDTFLTSNVGGGVKWFNGRWGLRADYRFVAVRSKDDAPAFFGQETRYGHRVYAGVLINAGR